MKNKEYNAAKLYKELEAAGLQIEGVTCEGRIDWKGEPSQVQLNEAETIKGLHEAQDIAALRRKAYLEKGLDTETLVVALWELVVEGKGAAADALQAVREQIKEEITTL